MNPMKPYWPESLNLHPVHLQAADAYPEGTLSQRSRSLMPYGYGILELAHDVSALLQGELVLRRARAVFPSGILFALGAESLERNVSAMLHETASSIGVYLGLPKAVPRGANVSPPDGVLRSRRFLAAEGDVPSMRPQVEVLFEGDPLDRFEVLSLGRIHRTARGLAFDPIPTALRVRASPNIQRGLTELIPVLVQRRDELGRARDDGLLDGQQFDLAYILQEYIAKVQDLADDPGAHPRDLHQVLAQFYAELKVFGGKEPGPPYVHEKTGESLPWFIRRISILVEQAARGEITMVPFERVDRTTFRVSFRREQLLGKRPFLVAVGQEERGLRERAPALLKMASPAVLAGLRAKFSPGVRVTVLNQSPRGVPTGPGWVAYSIDELNKYWLDIEDRQEIELYAPFAEPSLKFYLYGIRTTAL